MKYEIRSIKKSSNTWTRRRQIKRFTIFSRFSVSEATTLYDKYEILIILRFCRKCDGNRLRCQVSPLIASRLELQSFAAIYLRWQNKSTFNIHIDTLPVRGAPENDDKIDYWLCLNYRTSHISAHVQCELLMKFASNWLCSGVVHVGANLLHEHFARVGKLWWDDECFASYSFPFHTKLDINQETREEVFNRFSPPQHISCLFLRRTK